MKKRDPKKQAKLQKASTKRALYVKARKQKNKNKKVMRAENNFESATKAQ